MDKKWLVTLVLIIIALLVLVGILVMVCMNGMSKKSDGKNKDEDDMSDIVMRREKEIRDGNRNDSNRNSSNSISDQDAMRIADMVYRTFNTYRMTDNNGKDSKDDSKDDNNKKDGNNNTNINSNDNNSNDSSTINDVKQFITNKVERMIIYCIRKTLNAMSYVHTNYLQ